MATFTETIELKDEVSGAADNAKSAVLGLADSMGGLSKNTDGISDSMGGLAESSEGTTAELAELTGGLSIVAEAAGVAALAIGAIIVAGAAMAIKVGEATSKMRTMFDALGEGKISGDATIKMLDEIGDASGLTREAIAPLARDFMAMGVTNADALKKMTTAAISAQAIMGDPSAAQSFDSLSKKIQLAATSTNKLTLGARALTTIADTGANATDIAKKLGMSLTELEKGLKAGTINATKFGDALQDSLIEKGAGPMALMANSFSSIKNKFMENIGKMFEPASEAAGEFMAAVKDLFDIFGQGKASGQALSAGIGGFFKELFQTATKVVPYIKHFMLDLVILGLKAYIAVKPIVKYFQDLWKQHDGLGLLKKAFEAFGVILALVAVAVLVMLSPFIIAGVLFVALVAGVVALGVAFSELATYLTGALSAAGAALSEWVSSAADTAKNFIAGLVKGITDGAGMVVDAVKGLAKGAMDSITGALGIHSPSTVMMKLGGHTAGGFAEGIDGGASDVQASASGLATATVKGAAGATGAPGAPAPSGGGGGGGGVSVNVEPGAIVIQGAGKGVEELTEEAVSMIFERVALGAGL